MFVIEVIPVRKGIGKELLTYFSATALIEGNVVKIPLRGKFISGIVVSSTPVRAAKAELRKSDFALKKISSSEPRMFFESTWMSAVTKASQYFAASKGSIIAGTVPSFILENISKFSLKEKNGSKARTKKVVTNESLMPNVQCIQTENEERYGHYRAAVREEFARGKSLFLCLPTTQDIDAARYEFSRGITEYTYIFHSGLKKEEILKSWRLLSREKHPVLIIATPQWLCLPRDDVGTIIVDRENSSSWKTLSRPYIDMRKFAELLAAEKRARLILGSFVLRIDTLWRYKEEKTLPFESVKFRFSSGAHTAIVDMQDKKDEAKKPFRAVSKELISLVKHSKEENKNIFIYATRKGLASITVCNDCGEEMLCNNCSSPLVLYAKKDGNIFLCHQCGFSTTARELCRKCGSWRLLPLGVGIERVISEIESELPEANILQISRDTVTPLRASQIVEKFYKTPGSVLVGTEMALHYLNNTRLSGGTSGSIDFTAIASIDALFSVPDFRIREKIFNIVLSVKTLAREATVLQIRKAERRTLEYALSGNILDFYKMEIEERDTLGYPPFSVFVKITSRGTKSSVEKDAVFLTDTFSKWQPAVFPSSSERRGAQAAINCVLKIPISEYPQSLLTETLFSLPLNFEIKVDPENLL